MKKGVFLIVLGIIAVIAVYSVRPPSGFAESLFMAGQGKEFYLKEPVYYGLMVLSAAIGIFGVFLVSKKK